MPPLPMIEPTLPSVSKSMGRSSIVSGLQPPANWNDIADKSERSGFKGRERASREQQFESAIAADNARQVCEMDGGQEPEIDFRITECRVFRSHDDIAGDGQRHATPARRAAHGGYCGLAHGILDVP